MEPAEFYLHLPLRKCTESDLCFLEWTKFNYLAMFGIVDFRGRGFFIVKETSATAKYMPFALFSDTFSDTFLDTFPADLF